jgi:hypothetical protein
MSDLVMHSELLSNHGSETGLWDRFFFQIKDIAEAGFNKEAFESQSDSFFNKIMPEITNFYDIYNELRSLITQFANGVLDGTYYKVDERGSSHLDRSVELRIKQIVKDFFTRGKILLTSFAKSGLLVDLENAFSFNDFYFCDKKKFSTRVDNYIKSSDSRYLPVIGVIERANNSFLYDFNEVRNTIEHEPFALEKFTVANIDGSLTITEPILAGSCLSEAIARFYESIFDFMEKSMVYFFGITTEIKTNGFISIMIRNNYSYSSRHYKYALSFGGLVLYGGDATKCLYD